MLVNPNIAVVVIKRLFINYLRSYCGEGGGTFYQSAGYCRGRGSPQQPTMLRLETFICTFSLLSVAARADFKARNCSEAREACVAKGFSFTHVPLQEIPGKAAPSHQSSSRPQCLII